MTSVEAGVRELGHFIGGEFGGGGETFDDLDPFSGDLVAKVAAGGRDDAKRAIDAAAEAFTEWSQAPPAQRQAIFLRAADVLESRRDEVVSWLARETGSTFGFGMFQMSFVPGLFRQAAALAYAPIGQVIPSDHGAPSTCRTLARPLTARARGRDRGGAAAGSRARGDRSRRPAASRSRRRTWRRARRA